MSQYLLKQVGPQTDPLRAYRGLAIVSIPSQTGRSSDIPEIREGAIVKSQYLLKQVGPQTKEVKKRRKSLSLNTFSNR